MNTITNKFLFHPALKLAIEEAKKSEHQFRVGAVIFKGKRIISSAYNSTRSNQVPYQFKGWLEALHAECHAIIKAKKNLKGYSIIVVRLNKKNELTMAKPCNFCQDFIDYVGIKEIYWSNYNGELETNKGDKK